MITIIKYRKETSYPRPQSVIEKEVRTVRLFEIQIICHQSIVNWPFIFKSRSRRKNIIHVIYARIYEDKLDF